MGNKIDKYGDECQDLQLKWHGQIETINFNNMNERFYSELDKNNVDINEFHKMYSLLNDYFSREYEENKDESDDKFVKDVIKDMKRLIKIAEMIKGE